MSCASTRAITSVGPPAAKPTTILTGFTGYCCAAAGMAAAQSAAHSNTGDE
jgi:hypothetical protein